MVTILAPNNLYPMFLPLLSCRGRNRNQMWRRHRLQVSYCKLEVIEMQNSDFRAWDELGIGKDEEFIVPDPETYPGYGWGYHGPWDSEYWDDLGYWPDESYKP